jgi:hypothetical protein
MQTTGRTLEEVVRQLPREYQTELYDFAEFLLEKSRRKPTGRPSFRWAGALKELRAEYSSVELQHEVASWRVNEK